jgi:hypothetical protein
VLGDSLVEDEGAPYRVLPWSWTAERASQVACPATGGVDTDVAAILYTSGSTGAPKGVVLSHRNLVVGAESVSTYLNNTAEDRILAVLPLSFDAGLSQLTTGFCVGAHVVLADYLCREMSSGCAQEHRITGLVAYRRCGSSSQPRRGRPRRGRGALLRKHRGTTSARHPAKTASDLPDRGAIPHVRPH